MIFLKIERKNRRVLRFVVSFLVALLLLVLNTTLVVAAGRIGSVRDLIGNSPISSAGQISGIVAAGFTAAIAIAGAVSLGYIIYGGYKYSMSAGDGQSISAAINTIVSGGIGLIIVGLSVLIFRFIVVRVLKLDLGVFEFPF